MNPFPRLLLLALLISGCASQVVQNARAAYARGDYEASAEYYEQALNADPADEELRERLWNARAQAVADRVRSFDTAARARDYPRALSELLRAVKLRERWDMSGSRRLPQSTQANIATALTWAKDYLGSGILRELGAGRPLAASDVLDQSSSLFETPELKSHGAEFRAHIHVRGVGRCAELKQAAEIEASPYIASIVRAYCERFRVAVSEPPPGPEQVRELRVVGQIRGVSPAEIETLAAHLNRVFQRSPWYHQAAVHVADLRVAGELFSTHEVTRVTREVPWVEQVPYPVTESYQEPYQESYQELEYYDERVPYTDYETEWDECGFGSNKYRCSKRVPVTRYRDERRSRHVTKTRTRYRTNYRVVTYYRDEPRVFSYTAHEHHAQHVADLHVNIGSSIWRQPIVFSHSDSLSERDDEHNANFAPASVQPHSPNITAPHAFRDQKFAIVAAQVLQRAREQWLAEFCGPVDDLANAARCAHGRPSPLPSSTESMIALFIRDTVGPLFADP